jgi:hypothetical protein
MSREISSLGKRLGIMGGNWPVIWESVGKGEGRSRLKIYYSPWRCQAARSKTDDNIIIMEAGGNPPF